MGLLSSSATVVSPARVRANLSQAGDPIHGMYGAFFPPHMYGMLGGDRVPPEMALKLSYVYGAVDIISGDFGTCPCGVFQDLGDDGRRRVRFGDAGIGGLYYRLRWQPNAWQSSKAFWSTLAWQYLLRPSAYAEIVYRRGSDSVIDQLVPRHPDRVEQLRLANGSLAFKIHEPAAEPRYLTQAEMFVVRNTSTDGLNAIGRIEYGGATLSTALTLQEFTKTFFKKGITGALLATYKGGEMEPEDEADLHKSITRYVGGAENAGGVLLVPEDIDVKALGVDPEKAQLLGLKDLSGRDIARMFKLPPYKLAIAGTQTFASQVQSAHDYVNTCQMPLVREFQDAIYIHLIVARDYYAKFNTSHLTQTDAKTRMEAHEVAIRARVYRPSEARVMEDMSPDEELDRLSALDHRAGSQRDGQGNTGNTNSGNSARASGNVRLTLVMHDQANRVLEIERERVGRLAKRFASAEDVPKWRAELRTFYEEFAPVVAERMRIPIDIARAYAVQHAQTVESAGVVVMSDHWQRMEAESLVELSMEPESIDRLLKAA